MLSIIETQRELTRKTNSIGNTSSAMVPGVIWATPDEPHLFRDEVHVWCLALDEYVVYLKSFLQMLATEEVEKTWRYYFEKDREHFAVARGMTKTILGGYLKVMPNEVRFRYNSFGKPALADDCKADLRFNLSHSHGLALLAVAREREVGIDLEYQRPEIATEDIAERFFSATEVKSLARLPKEMQAEAFFKCWTRKEAYIKAIGEGLSFPLDQFSVSLHPSELPELREVVGNRQEMSRWSFWDLSPNSRYAAALVVEGSNLRLRCFQGFPFKPHVSGVTDSSA